MGIELPLPAWMEWIVTGTAVIIGGASLYVISWIDKRRRK